MQAVMQRGYYHTAITMPRQIVPTPHRTFFRSKKEEEKKEPAKEPTKDHPKEHTKEHAKEHVKDKDHKEEPAKKQDAKASEKKPEVKEDKKQSKNLVADKAGSEKEDKEEGSLSKDDIARIKALFNEQEEDIKTLSKNEELLKDNLKNLEKQLDEKAHEISRHEKEMVLVRVEYTKQVHENEETVRRYRKIIEEEKVFAITKFAKDLLEVRDNLRFSLENTDMEAVDTQTDL